MDGDGRGAADQRAAQRRSGAGDHRNLLRARAAARSAGETCQTTRTVLRHAISADGSRAFWTYVPESPSEPSQLYARLDGSETIQLDKAANPKNSGSGVFRAASADGSVVYFTAANALLSGANPEKANQTSTATSSGCRKPKR